MVVTVACAFCDPCGGDAFGDGGGLCSVLGCLTISSSPVGWNMSVEVPPAVARFFFETEAKALPHLIK